MKYLILGILLMFSSALAQNTNPPYMDNMTREQICFNVGGLALMISEVYIYYGKEPKVSNGARKSSEFEKRLIVETKRRVQELLDGENGLKDPELIKKVITQECMINLKMKGEVTT
tara:strand:+ start:757 stop:1104 length:348 start_codon:yes stop_codon:yes gene_type:complete